MDYTPYIIGFIIGFMFYTIVDHMGYQKLKNKNKQNYVTKIIQGDVKNHLYNTKLRKKSIPLIIPNWLKKAERNSKKKRENTFTVNPIRGLNIVPNDDIGTVGKQNTKS